MGWIDETATSLSQRDYTPEEIKREIDKSANEMGFDPQVAQAVAKVESNYNQKAKSPAGAIGTMQLMPGTARDLGVNPHSMIDNVRGGITYLKRLSAKYGGDLVKTLASYNWGPGNVEAKGIDNMPTETSQYIDRVKKNIKPSGTAENIRRVALNADSITAQGGTMEDIQAYLKAENMSATDVTEPSWTQGPVKENKPIAEGRDVKGTIQYMEQRQKQESDMFRELHDKLSTDPRIVENIKSIKAQGGTGEDIQKYLFKYERIEMPKIPDTFEQYQQKLKYELAGQKPPSSSQEAMQQAFGRFMTTATGLSGGGLEVTPLTEAGAIGAEVGTVGGLVAGPGILAGGMVKTAFPGLSLKATDGIVRTVLKGTATSAMSLPIALGIIKAGEFINDPNNRWQIAKDIVLQGGKTGAEYGILGNIDFKMKFPSVLVRLATKMVADYVIEGQHPFDDRSITEKTRDYTMDLIFLWHGMSPKERMRLVREATGDISKVRKLIEYNKNQQQITHEAQNQQIGYELTPGEVTGDNFKMRSMQTTPAPAPTPETVPAPETAPTPAPVPLGETPAVLTRALQEGALPEGTLWGTNNLTRDQVLDKVKNGDPSVILDIKETAQTNGIPPVVDALGKMTSELANNIRDETPKGLERTAKLKQVDAVKNETMKTLKALEVTKNAEEVRGNQGQVGIPGETAQTGAGVSSENLQQPEKTRATAGNKGKQIASNILLWVKSKGGIDYNKEHWKGELDTLKEMKGGYRFIINKQGKGYSLDELSLMAKDEGWISEATPQAMLDALTNKIQHPRVAEEKIYKTMEAKRANIINENKNSIELDPSKLKEGDSVMINGERFTHKGFDKDGNIVIADSENYRLDIGDKLMVDKNEKGEAKVVPGKKELWQMTAVEYRNYKMENLSEAQKRKWRDPERVSGTKANVENQWDAEHKEIIEQARSEGKPITERKKEPLLKAGEPVKIKSKLSVKNQKDMFGAGGRTLEGPLVSKALGETPIEAAAREAEANRIAAEINKRQGNLEYRGGEAEKNRQQRIPAVSGFDRGSWAPAWESLKREGWKKVETEAGINIIAPDGIVIDRYAKELNPDDAANGAASVYIMNKGLRDEWQSRKYVELGMNFSPQAWKDFKDAWARQAEKAQSKISSMLPDWWRRFWNPMATLNDSAKYLVARMKYEGSKDILNDTVSAINKEISSLSEVKQKYVLKYLLGDVVLKNPANPPDWMRPAINVKEWIHKAGVDLVRKGILKEEQRLKFEDGYLPQLYMKHLLSEGGQSGTRIYAPFSKHRKLVGEQYKQIRESLGEITEPNIRASVAISNEYSAIYAHDFFEKIAANSEFSYQAGLADWPSYDSMMQHKQTGRYSAPWIKDEIAYLREIRDRYPDRAASINPVIAEGEQALKGVSYPHEGEGWTKVPESKAFGNLRGMWVRDEIASDLKIGLGFGKDAPNLLDKITRWFKIVKVPFNPPTQVRNMVSNSPLLEMSGMSLVEQVVMAPKIIKDFYEKGPYWQLAKSYGFGGATFSANELRRIKKDFNPDKGIFDTATNYIGKKLDIPIEFYGKVEMFYKTMRLAYGIEKEKLTPDDAAIVADKALFNYSMVSPAIDKLRKSVIGAPFVSFPYFTLPSMVDSAIKRPWMYAKYLAVPAMLTAYVQHKYNLDDKEWKKMLDVLPKYISKFGVYVLPIYDSTKKTWQFFDFSYFLPWGNIARFFQDIKNADWQQMLQETGLFGGPIPQIATVITTGIDPFTDKTLFKPEDSHKDKALRLLGWAYQVGVPTFITDIGVAGHLKDYLEQKIKGQETQRYGTPVSAINVFPRAAGVNIYPVNIQKAKTSGMKQKMSQIMELKRRIVSVNKTEKDPDTRVRIREKAMQKIREIQATMPPSVFDIEQKMNEYTGDQE